jgi:hypothetical protein
LLDAIIRGIGWEPLKKTPPSGVHLLSSISPPLLGLPEVPSIGIGSSVVKEYSLVETGSI